jgi:hypothetical protein
MSFQKTRQIQHHLNQSHRRAYLAYRHQLLGTQYAEMAALEEEEADFDEDETQAAQA